MKLSLRRSLITGLLLPALACLILAAPAFAGPGSEGHGGAHLGPASTKCVGCHEGVLSGGVVSHRGGTTHPVGVDYLELSRRNPSLVPPEKLNKAMPLEDGRIGCLTCHVPYDSKNHSELARKRAGMGFDEPDPMLSVDNRGSALCMGCHRK